METVEIKLTDFKGGMSNETREQIQGVFSYAENFDNRSEKGVLTPRPLIEKDGGSYTTTDNMKSFALSVGGDVYALGDQRIDYLSGAFTGSPVWNGAVNGFDGSFHASNPEAGLLIYKNYLYWLVNNKTFQRYGDITGTPSLNMTFAAFANSITPTSKLFLGKDSNFYLGYKDNAGLTKLARLTSGGVLTEGVLTLPNDMTIVSLAWYGNYLAIGCVPDVQTRESRIYLWDYSQNDVQEAIEVGQDRLRSICNLEGYILMAMQKTTTDEVYFDFYPKTGVNLPVFKAQDSSLPVVVISPDTLATASAQFRVFNKTAYIGVQYTFDTGSHLSYRYGIARIGRKKPTDPFSLVIDGRLGTETGQITDCLMVGRNASLTEDLIYGTYTDASHTSMFATKSGYSTATLETLIYGGANPEMKKKLKAVAITYKPLPAAGQFVVKYRKDAETSWTTIFTEGTDNSTSRLATAIETTVKALPEFKEIQFQIISTGGATLTGFKFKYKTTQNIYGK